MRLEKRMSFSRDPVEFDAKIDQRLVHPGLKGPERAAALQDEHDEIGKRKRGAGSSAGHGLGDP